MKPSLQRYSIVVAILLGALLTVECYPKQDEGLSVEEEAPKIEEIDYEDKPVIKIQEGGEDGLAPQARISYSGSQLWKVFLDSNEKRRALLKLKEGKDISTWGGNRTALDILVKPQSKNSVTRVFNQHKIDYEVLLEDVQKAIDEENPPPSEEEEELANRKGHRMSWQSYHRLSDINEYLDYLAVTYPKLCSVRQIGQTIEGRPMKVLKISNGNPRNRAVWLDGGIHAREWISPASVTYIINYLVENFDRENKDMQNIDWHVLPVANPDGYEYSHSYDRLWRKNRARHQQCLGTDLNRNFGYRWGGRGSGKNPCQETYGGRGPFSEPETTAIKGYITGVQSKWKAYISFHSYGQYILYPWGYEAVVPPDYKELQQVGNEMANAMRQAAGGSYRVGSSASTLYPAAGGSDDWAKGVAGFKFAYTIELRDQGRYGFILPASFIEPTAKEALAAIRVLATAVNSV